MHRAMTQAKSEEFGYKLEKTDERGKYRVVTQLGAEIGFVWKSPGTRHWKSSIDGTAWNARRDAVWRLCGGVCEWELPAPAEAGI